jgi:hypothetical protein
LGTCGELGGCALRLGVTDHRRHLGAVDVDSFGMAVWSHDVRVQLGGVGVVVKGFVKHCRAHLGAVDGEWTQFVMSNVDRCDWDV